MSFKLHMSLCHKSYRTDRYEFGRIKKLGNIHIHFWYWLHCKCFGCNGKHSESESKSLALSCSESRPYPNPYPYPCPHSYSNSCCNPKSSRRPLCIATDHSSGSFTCTSSYSFLLPRLHIVTGSGTQPHSTHTVRHSAPILRPFLFLFLFLFPFPVPVSFSR